MEQRNHFFRMYQNDVPDCNRRLFATARNIHIRVCKEVIHRFMKQRIAFHNFRYREYF